MTNFLKMNVKKNFLEAYKGWLSTLISDYPEIKNFSEYLKQNHQQLLGQIANPDDQNRIKIYQKFFEKNSVLLKKYCFFKLDSTTTRIQKILSYLQSMSLNDLLECKNFIENMKAFHRDAVDMALHVIKESVLLLTDALRNELNLLEDNPISEAILLSGLYFRDREDPSTFLEEIEIALAQEIGRKQTGSTAGALQPQAIDSLDAANHHNIKENVRQNEATEIESAEEIEREFEVDQEDECEECEKIEAVEAGEKEIKIEHVEAAELEQEEIQEQNEKENLEAEEEGQKEEKEKAEDEEESEEEDDAQELEDEELEDEQKAHQEEVVRIENIEIKGTAESKEQRQELAFEKPIQKLTSWLKRILPAKRQAQLQILSPTETDSEIEMFKLFKADTHLNEQLIDESIQKTKIPDSLAKTASLLSIPEAKIQLKPIATGVEENKEDNLEDLQDEKEEKF